MFDLSTLSSAERVDCNEKRRVHDELRGVFCRSWRQKLTKLNGNHWTSELMFSIMRWQRRWSSFVCCSSVSSNFESKTKEEEKERNDEREKRSQLVRWFDEQRIDEISIVVRTTFLKRNFSLVLLVSTPFSSFVSASENSYDWRTFNRLDESARQPTFSSDEPRTIDGHRTFHYRLRNSRTSTVDTRWTGLSEFVARNSGSTVRSADLHQRNSTLTRRTRFSRTLSGWIRCAEMKLQVLLPPTVDLDPLVHRIDFNSI